MGSSFVLGAEALHLQWYAGAIFILAVAGVKEATFDVWVEGGTYRDGLVDWLFYLLGCLASAAVMVL
ncbi:MAG: hypothetical protein KGI33_00640 [Thaumarchaeota archaeon]|nr:hypothetical protein [Nitrososphaerota archaeon]